MDRISHTKGRFTAKEFAYSEIKEQIIKGSLRADEAIIEETLAMSLEISRTPLREALQRLEQEDMIVRQHNGRLKVAPLSIQEVKELFIVRGKLESIMVTQATENATEKDINKLTIIINMIKETEANGEVEDILYYGSQFHKFIYQLSRNKTVNKILQQLNDRIHRYQHLLPNDDANRFQSSYKEHQVILDYIKKGDQMGAQMAMESHIENSLDAVVQAIWNLHQEAIKEGVMKSGK